MNKIEKMVKELCPDGIEWKKLGEVTIKNQFKQLGANELEKLRVDGLTGLGNSIRLLPSSNNDDWWSNENIAKKYICYGEVITLGRARYANLKYHKGYFVSANNNIIETKENILTCRFLYHFISHSAKKFYIETSTYPKFDVNIFDNFLIPIPPLEVQAEIVKILDNFTELQAELQARKSSMNIIEISYCHLTIF